MYSTGMVRYIAVFQLFLLAAWFEDHETMLEKSIKQLNRISIRVRVSLGLVLGLVSSGDKVL